MSLSTLWQRLRHRARYERELDDELAFHLAERCDQLRREGFEDAEAIRRARIELGMIESHKDAVRAAHGLAGFDQWLGELRRALRSLARSPLFSAVAIVILGCAIAVNLALFSIYDSYALRTPAIVQHGALLDLAELRGADGERRPRLTADELRDIAPALADDSRGLLVSNAIRMMLGGDAPRTAYGLSVNGDYLPLLDARARIGRILDARDDQSGAAPTLVLSDAGWRALTDADPGIIGKTLNFSGVDFTVVGVMPPDFVDLQPLPPQYWISTEGYATWRGHYTGSDYFEGYDVSVLLAPGASLQRLHERLRPALSALPTRTAQSERIDAFQLLPRTSLLAATDAADARIAAMPVFALVMLVLVVACANLANLMLARATARRQELAIRASVGASRWRLIRQLMTESGLLAMAAALIGLLLCALSVEPLHRYALSTMIGLGMSPIDIHIDWRTFVAASALAAVATISFGLLPALAATERQLSSGTRRDATIAAMSPSRLRGLLMVLQIAASLVLLVVAALIVATAHRAQHIDTGFDVERLMDLRHPAADAELRRRIEQIPGVSGTTSVARVPLYGWQSRSPAVIDGTSLPLGVNVVDERFFGTLGIGLIAGRDFRAEEASNGSDVAIISAATARTLWPGRNPLGRRLRFAAEQGGFFEQSREVEVIGVAADIASGLLFTGLDATAVYVPGQLSQPLNDELVLAVDPARADAIRRELVRVCNERSRAQPCEPWRMTQVAAMQRMPFEIARSVASALGLVALLISAIGLYGVVRFTVASRTREIGVRIALGATATGVIRLVLRGALRQVAWGVAIGLPICLFVSWAISGTVGRALAFTPIAYLGVPLLLLMTALLATLLPARRATRIAPTVALREE